jgi:predicted RNase H-like HicB family nuclease
MKATDYGMILVWSEEDDAYLARVLELPGCAADGKTREEAIANAVEAIEDWIATAKELGREVPPPLSDQQYYEQAKEFAAQNQAQFQKAVSDAVQRVLKDFVPKLHERSGYSVFSGASTWRLVDVESPEDLVSGGRRR